MGREWYFSWGSKSTNKKAAKEGGGDTGKRTDAPPAATVAAAAAEGVGCMNAVFQLFDFQHLQFCICSHPHDSNPTNSSFLSRDPTSLKGVVGASKSLELMEEAKPNRRDTKLKVAIQAPTDDKKQDDSCSEGARTPNLVARLMGLDILPESSNTTTPRSSHSQSVRSSPHMVPSSTPPSSSITRAIRKTRPRSSYNNDVPGPKSLPETPRSTSSSKSRSHVLERHRLSLEFNKENSIVREMESSRPSCSAISTKRRELGRSSNLEEESRSPRYYARQIMKQVKETVSRRRRSVGADITNTVNSSEHRRDEHLLSISSSTKPKKSSEEYSSSPCNKSSTRFKSSLNSENPSALSECAKSEPVLLKPTDQEKQEPKRVTRSAKSCSKKPPQKSLDPIRKKKEEQFIRPPIDKKCKKTPLSSHDSLHGSLVPVKKDYSCSPLATKLPQKQEAPSKAAQASKLMSSTKPQQLTRNPSQWRCERERAEEAKHHAQGRGRGRGRRSKDVISSIAEFQYISRILKCTGIDRDTPISLTTWFSPTCPLDPSIFHNLENAHYTATTNDDTSPADDQLCLSFDNRRLIFHLVDEILADILKPLVRLKPWVFNSSANDHHHHHHQQQQQQQQKQKQQLINGFELVKTLCRRIRNIPCMDCQTLQDIDALVEKDLPKFEDQSNFITFEEEGQAIVSEIEHEIVDSLIQEIAVFCLGRHRRSMQRYVTIIRVEAQ